MDRLELTVGKKVETDLGVSQVGETYVKLLLISMITSKVCILLLFKDIESVMQDRNLNLI